MFDSPLNPDSPVDISRAADLETATLGLFDDGGTPIDRFAHFWRAVVYRTARDALGLFSDGDIPGGMTRSRYMAEARSFFENATDFPASVVVEMAGFDPEYVAAKARRIDWNSLERPAR